MSGRGCPPTRSPPQRDPCRITLSIGEKLPWLVFSWLSSNYTIVVFFFRVFVDYEHFSCIDFAVPSVVAFLTVHVVSGFLSWSTLNFLRQFRLLHVWLSS